jgi:uncharacterized repeat protein (TIGR03806 family)
VSVNPAQISPVVLDLNSAPYKTLSEYNFFEGKMSNLIPVYGVLPYKIKSGLFIDYAKAKTFVWMPKGVKAKYVDDHSVFDFPDGAVLITTHYFENVLPENNTQMIETRLIIKKQGEWVLANYKWNEDQTQATYTTDGSFVGVRWMDDNNETRTVNYKIPSYDECYTCHNKYDKILPIGTKPQNINHSITFKDGIKNQLNKWAEFGYLDSDYPSNIKSVVNWEDETQPLGLRARSYLDINCAHCHSDKGYCEYAPMRFAFNQTDSLVNMGVGVKHGFEIEKSITNIIAPGSAENSALLYRISSTLDEYKMPIIGRTLQHKEGVALLEKWINSLENTHN